jgi:hypothetical protein
VENCGELLALAGIMALQKAGLWCQSARATTVAAHEFFGSYPFRQGTRLGTRLRAPRCRSSVGAWGYGTNRTAEIARGCLLIAAKRTTSAQRELFRFRPIADIVPMHVMRRTILG